jgi:hypothetical protein
MTKLNNILISVFTILMLASITICAASTSTTINIASQTVNVTGDTVIVPIMANNITNVAAYTISMTYNRTVVVVDSVGAGALGGVTKVIDNVTGVTQMSAFSTTPLSGNVILANIVLRAVGTAGQTSPLTLSITTLSDDNGNTIPANVDNGTFSVATLAIPILDISVSPTSVTTGVPTKVTFTVTSNGSAINGATVTMSGNATGSNTTDVNGNTVINVNATGVGSITATTSMTGYTSGTASIIVTPVIVPLQDILTYYRGLGQNSNIVETRDLLKAADDQRNKIVPPGFSVSITYDQLLTLAEEWKNS